MNRSAAIRITLLTCAIGAALVAPAADNPAVLLGSWSGKAAGTQGGPPTGDITVTFEKEGSGIEGRIVVTGSGGAEYSGQVSEVQLKNKLFSALVVFKLGENPLEVRVSGPLKGKSIEGSFTVFTKGQKMGDGTFAITKIVRTKPAKK